MTEGVKAGVWSVVCMVILTLIEVFLTVACFKAQKKCPFVESHERKVHN